MFEVMWMTALGFALPAIGADRVDVVSAGYAQSRSCGTDFSGEAYLSGFSHSTYGELFITVHTEDGVVTEVDVMGGRLEGDALFSTDQQCEDAPLLAFAVNTMGVEVTIERCTNGNLMLRERGVSMGNMMCLFDDTILPTLRAIFARAQ